ncbi:hypothetical protein, partial [Streptococcus iniae]|uniref:hypothetical protein n=1 Tax=Streptococcus iniae TaxID=1346 RepID=UPI000F184619
EYVLTHLIAYLTNIQKLYSCVYTKLLTVSIVSDKVKKQTFSNETIYIVCEMYDLRGGFFLIFVYKNSL